jgi:phage tail P2-like protein
MAKDIYELSLRDITPPSIASDPQIQAMMDALDPELQSVSLDTSEALIYSRIEELSEPVIDLLAWQFHVDFYEPINEPLSLPVKRRLIETSILLHKRKGTRWAVKELCDIVFGATAVEAWFEYDGDPYHFRVTTEATLPKDAWYKFFYALEMVKSVRDWLDAIQIQRDFTLPIHYGTATVTKGRFDINFSGAVPTYVLGELYAGILSGIGGSIDIAWFENEARCALSQATGMICIIHGYFNILCEKEV